MRIAIIGSGISGLGAALALHPHHDITVFEAAQRAGGHSATVDVAVNGKTIPVDTGFIVYNKLNYPNLVSLFELLNVETLKSDMSFAFSLDDGAFEWAGADQLWKLFAQPRNLISPRFWRMLREMMRFNAAATADLKNQNLHGLDLQAYLTKNNFSDDFQRRYLLPMGAAIWSMSQEEMLRFPAESFFAFFDNHRLMSIGRPEWRTVKGGSRTYVDKIAQKLGACLKLGTPVQRVMRKTDNVEIDADGQKHEFDQVIFACHSDQALKILHEPNAQEASLLGAVRYKANDVWLHGDTRLMPKRRRAWAAWNYLASTTDDEKDVAVTYWMNLLQSIEPVVPIFVSLNPPFPPDAAKVYGRFSYAHPQYDAAALQAQKDLDSIQGKNRLWFCGAWTGYGFHEDGLKSGLAVAKALGGALPGTI